MNHLIVVDLAGLPSKNLAFTVHQLKCYGNTRTLNFYLSNPLIKLRSTYSDPREVASKLGVYPSRVGLYTRRDANLHELRMIESDYKHEEYEEEISSDEFSFDISQLNASIEEIDNQSILELRSHLETKVIDMLPQKVRESVSEPILNSTVLIALDNTVTKEALAEELSKDSVARNVFLTERQLPQKVQPGMLQNAIDYVSSYLNELPNRILAETKAQPKTEQKPEKFDKPKPTGRPPSRPGSRGGSRPSSRASSRAASPAKVKKEPMAELVAERRAELVEDSEDEGYQRNKQLSQVTQAQQLVAVATENEKVPASLVPIWHFPMHDNDDSRQAALDRYLSDLAHFKSLKFNIPENRLIFASLNASSRSSMIDEIPSSCLQDIDSFSKHLRKAYGYSLLSLREQLSRLKRKRNESPHALMTRCINLYFRSKNKEPLPLNDLLQETNQIARDDIFHVFLSSLTNDRLKTMLRLKAIEVTFDEIPDLTKRIESALSESPDNRITAYENKLDLIAYARGQGAHKRKRDTPKKGKCFRCQRQGHWREDCFAKRREDGSPIEDKPKPKTSEKNCTRCKRSGHTAQTCKVKTGKPIKK